MKKTKETPEKRCPVCGKTQNQAKKGFNKSRTQKVFCKECGRNYTINPKRHAYPEETQKLALKIFYSGVSGRGVGKILGMNKSNVYNWIKKNSEK
jgi:transposase-like protein